jgi:hypothetical protein
MWSLVLCLVSLYCIYLYVSCVSFPSILEVRRHRGGLVCAALGFYNSSLNVCFSSVDVSI